MTHVVLVGGTWAYDGDFTCDEWNHHDSPFSKFLLAHDIEHARPCEPFLWDGNIAGVWNPFAKRNRTVTWSAAGWQLALYLKDLPLADRNVVTHSHGGNCLAFAASRVMLNRVVTVTMPVRNDMQPHYQTLRRHAVRGWTHVHANGNAFADKMQVLGALFDGAWGIHREVKIAGVENVGIPGIGHSGLFCDPEQFHWWEDSGLIPFLKGEGMGAAA